MHIVSMRAQRDFQDFCMHTSSAVLLFSPLAFLAPSVQTQVLVQTTSQGHLLVCQIVHFQSVSDISDVLRTQTPAMLENHMQETTEDS